MNWTTAKTRKKFNKFYGMIVSCLGLNSHTLLATDQVAPNNLFSATELQLHAEWQRQPLERDMFTATVEHFSKWTYGDNFFFLDLEGQPDFSTQANTLYFEYAPRISLDQILQRKLLPNKYLGELYATVQYNDSDQDFIHQVWLYGLSLDLAGQPNHGYSNLHWLLRAEDTQATAYQLTVAWGQPFQVGPWHFTFQGFADYWQDDEKHVFLTEPQLRWSLGNLLGNDSIFSRINVGTEIEISKDFFGKNYGWEVNPTVFMAFSF